MPTNCYENCNDILDKLHSLRNEKNIEGMARFGINPEGNLGISVTELRKIGREILKGIRKDGERRHELALHLWDSGIRDARVLATIIDDPAQVTGEQLESWVEDLDSWDVCDGCCGNLFDRTPFAYGKAEEWTERDGEFVKRAGFALQAWLAVHDKKAPDSVFERFFISIKREAHDDRNYVRKAVNWALRNIGKRNHVLNSKAIVVAREIAGMDSRAARWNGKDALRELTGEKVRKKLEKMRE